MARPLKIGLGIDFSRFDKDLAGIADRIEGVGKSASVKLGGAVASVGSVDTAQLGQSVADVGVMLSQSIAAGVRQSSGIMVGFASHLDTIMNRFAGAAITIFQRIDAAMKFPMFDAFLSSATVKLKNFTAIWRKPVTDLDLAISGVFGDTMARAARVAKVLIDSLAAAISGALKAAVADVVAEFAKMALGMGRAEASAEQLMQTTQKTAAAARQFDMGGKGMRNPMPGPKIGAGTDFLAKAKVNPTLGMGDPRRGPIAGGKEELMALGRAAMFAASLLPRVGVAFLSIPLGVITPLMRLRNFLSTLGGVGKKTFDDMYKSSSKTGVAISAMGAPVKAFTGTVGAAGQATKTLGSSIVGLGGQIAAAFGVVGVIYKTVQFLKDGVVAASDLNESVNASKQVFGTAFGPIEEQVQGLNRQFGLSQKTLYDVASGFSAMAQGVGMSAAESANFSKKLVQMTADLSSNKNLPLQEAADKMTSALAGELEPLKRYGVLLLDDTVKAYALSHGIASSAKTMTNQQKIVARSALIMEGLNYAQGDLARTQGDAANQFRKAGGGVEAFGIKIGQLLLPAIKVGTQAFNEFMAITLEVFEASQPTLAAWGASLTGIFERVGTVVRNLGAFYKIAQLRVGEFVINTIAWIQTIPANFGPITEWVGKNWWNLLTDMLNATMSVFANLGTNAINFGKAFWAAIQGDGFQFNWTPLLEGFKATAEALPELVQPSLISVDDEVNRILGDVAKKEEVRKAALSQAAAPVKPPGAAMGDTAAQAGKQGEYKLASAVEIGSKEASSILARAAAGGKQDTAKQGLNVAKDSNATLKQISQKLDRSGMAFAIK